MSRQTRFPALDHEPKASQGPPPAYRSGSATVTDFDVWSQYSDSSGLGRRRASWSNLVESDENLNKHKVNCYPKVHAPFKNQALAGSASMISTVQPHPSSRTSSQMGVGMEGYYQGKGAMPVFADPSGVPPAGSIQYSRPPSKTPSMAHILETPSDLPAKTKRNRLQECNAWCKKPACAFCLLLIIVVVIIGTVLAIVLTQVLIPPKNLTMSWLPPEILRTSQSAASRVIMTADGNQVRMQLQGAPPFKGNYVNYYDFKANRVVVIDESLKNNGKNIACFVLPLDRSNLQGELDMRKAANAGKKRTSQSQGWGEQWTWISSPLLTPPVLEPAIPECDGVRWIQLDYISTNQQNRKCTDCHDFCLPDYGIEKDQVRDENYLNILRRNCFYLFVPEWRSFAQSHSIEQNQRDFEQYYRNRNHITTSYGGPNNDPKWIPLAIPQQIANTTRHVANGVINSVTGTVDNLKNAVFGQNNNNQHQGGYGQQGYNNMDGSIGGNNPGNNNGVAGVVNLHGVNGNNGGNMYNMGSQQNMMNQQQNSQLPESYRSYPNSGYSNNNNNNNNNNNGDQMNQNQPPPYQMSGFGANPNFNSAQQNTRIESRSGYVPDVAPVSNQPSYQQSNNPYSASNGYSQNIVSNANNNNNPNNNNGYNNPANPVISSSYSIAVGENGRPSYPDQNGVNPPSGYVPQVAQQVNTPMQQGVSGMALPPIDTTGRHTGYTPDIMNQQMQQQQQQQQQQQAPPGGRWSAG